MEKTLIILTLLATASCRGDLKTRIEKIEEENKILKELAGPLPASLDNYYPPESSAPVYLLSMFSIATPLEGIGADLQENDMAGARVNFDVFKSNYIKVRAMVEDWTEKFPLDVVDSLGQAISEGNPARIGAAMAQVGSSCTSCHLISQIKAQQKYHWPDFGLLTLSNPDSGAKLSWYDYMMNMSVSFSGISTSLQQGQLENARKYYREFSSQFSAMAEGCFDCHSTSRAYYTDEFVTEMIKDLGNALDSPSPDQNVIQQITVEIGNEGCLKCHYLHMPSVITKKNWKNFEVIFEKP